ncbi:hypothetical protein BJ742DRAFT_148358 [Cladochytrium replicatum]|nr:hypothetical protein BJ742DRAFT_148358 [Cladochytrium replicatum]
MNFGPEWMRKASIHGNVGTAVPASQNPAPHPGFGRGGAAPLPTSLTGWNTAVGGGQNASKAPSSPVGTRRPVSATELMLTPGHPIPGPRNTGASQYQSVASNGMSTSFPSNAGMMGSHIPPAATSEYRYSRDIMLSLFDPDYPTPENMEFHDFVMSRTAREPMANTPLTQNERKLLASNNVNSDPRGSGSANPQNNNAGQTGAPSAPGRFSRDRGQSGDGISSAGPTVGGIGRGIGRGTPIRRKDNKQLKGCFFNFTMF